MRRSLTGPLIVLAVGLSLALPGAAGAQTATRPPQFWRTPAQAIAIAEREPEVRAIERQGGVHAHAKVAALGLWGVTFERQGKVLAFVRVEDRAGQALPRGQADWPTVGSKLDPYKRRLELVLAILAVGFLALFFDWRRPRRLHNLDVLVLLSFGAALVFYDRLHPTVSVPLLYPPLGYLFVRLLLVGWRGAHSGRRLVPWASARTLLLGLVALEALRIAFSFAYPATTDVSYASVFGAEGIHHGLPIYTTLHARIHLDTYGPLNYLAYLPFELVWPMNANWLHDHLPAAHAAALSFELLTILGLFVLGRRITTGPAGSRLGLALACAWVAYPFTLFPLAQSSNDGLIALLLVWALVALSSPVARGMLLGAAVAAKFTPLALAGLFAAGRGGERRREVPRFALAAVAVVAISVWAYLPHPGGLRLFWDDTVGYQLARRSFMSLWGQHPGLGFARSAVMVATIGVAAATLLVPRRRDTAQVAALAGAIVIGVEICLRFWSFYYVAWFAPFAIAGLLVARQAAVSEETSHAPAGSGKTGALPKRGGWQEALPPGRPCGGPVGVQSPTG